MRLLDLVRLDSSQGFLHRSCEDCPHNSGYCHGSWFSLLLSLRLLAPPGSSLSLFFHQFATKWNKQAYTQEIEKHSWSWSKGKQKRWKLTELLNIWIASLASSMLPIVTNPNPLLLSVTLSYTICRQTTMASNYTPLLIIPSLILVKSTRNLKIWN